MRHQQLWSFGDEGHAWIEKHPKLRPLRGGVDSNRLTRADLNSELVRQLRQDMLLSVISAKGNRVNSNTDAVRIIEKTPKNCLRIPFIDEIYPDARYIYLYRDPKESIASIIEGWRHQKFVTYGDVRMAHGKWCFLRPPSWQKLINQPIYKIAAFQWQSCQEIILDDLAGIESNRWTICAFDELLTNTRSTVRRLEEFCELTPDPLLESYCKTPLPLSKYTQTKPAQGKWRQHYAEISLIFPSLDPTIARINDFAATGWQLDTKMPPMELYRDLRERKLGRNELCFCGSGLKYKSCHGLLT